MNSQQKNTSNDIFPRNLLEAMRDKGWTQAQLGEATGLAQGTISNYLRGKREPTSSQLYALSQALGVTMEWLLHNHPVRSIEGWISKIEGTLNEPIGDRLRAELREEILRSDARVALNLEKQAEANSQAELRKIRGLISKLADKIHQADKIVEEIEQRLG